MKEFPTDVAKAMNSYIIQLIIHIATELMAIMWKVYQERNKLNIQNESFKFPVAHFVTSITVVTSTMN